MDLKFTHDIGPDNVVILDKLFQFTILGSKLESSFYKMVQFNAICVKFDNYKNQNSISIECDVNSHNVVNDQLPKFNDRVSYFKELDILKQFWGGGCYASENKSEFCDHIINILKLNPGQDRKVKDEIYSEVVAIYKLCSGNGFPILVDENKEGITPFIIIPSHSKFYKTKVTLAARNISRFKNLARHLSFGFWFQSEFKRKLKTIHDELFFDAKIEFPLAVNSPDFKVYFQIGSDVKIKSNQVSIENGQEPIKAEIIRVFSQSKIKYFTDWADLGIYKAALLRFENSKRINNEIMTNGVKIVRTQLNLEDTTETNRKRLHLFILSILVSALAAMGLDATRQGLPAFKMLFPEILFFSNEFTWVLVCLGILVKYKYVLIDAEMNKAYRYITYFCFAPLFFWLFACFFVDSEFILSYDTTSVSLPNPAEDGKTKLFCVRNWFQSVPVFDFFLNIYLVTTLAGLNFYRKNENSMKSWLKKSINLVTGVRL